MLYPSHPFFSTFRKCIQQAALQGPVYDLGTSERFAKEMEFVQKDLEGVTYIAGGFSADGRAPEGCDIFCDVQNLENIPTGSVGSVICLEVLEHVQSPERCVAELYRVLKPGGICILSTPFMAGYHGKRGAVYYQAKEVKNDHGSYADYWRFTHEGLFHLFEQAKFSSTEVLPVNGPLSARFELMKGGKILEKIPFLARAIYRFEKPTLGKLTTRHFVFAKK